MMRCRELEEEVENLEADLEEVENERNDLKARLK